MIHFRNAVIPLVSLSKVLESRTLTSKTNQKQRLLLYVKAINGLTVTVDEFIGQSEIVLKTLGKYLTNIEAISGATILGDGQVALIIDPNALIK